MKRSSHCCCRHHCSCRLSPPFAALLRHVANFTTISCCHQHYRAHGAPHSIELANRVFNSMADLTKEGSNLVDYHSPPQPEWRVLVAGATAGLVVDTSLFPIDTIKSRLQSKSGFIKSGGFSHLYRGLPPVLAGSIPNAALFFITYESVKDKLHHYKPFSQRGNAHVISHVIAASLGEVVSCTVRNPYEIVKMRSQTSLGKQVASNTTILKQILAKEGINGLYRGFTSTIIRDIPFSAIQYPIWERLKANHLKRHHKAASAPQSAFYGSLAGAVAAFITTPLDVAKTRIMLADSSDSMASGKVMTAMKAIHNERGIRGLFAGVVPRVIWISVGAAIFLGSYEKAIKVLS